jgi:hypothetical protein
MNGKLIVTSLYFNGEPLVASGSFFTLLLAYAIIGMMPIREDRSTAVQTGMKK